MDVSLIIKKTKVEFNLCKKIKQDQNNIYNELCVILTQRDGYIYNTKKEKRKKHFPASLNINYDTYNKFLVKEKNKHRQVSFSLSSRSIPEQLNDILSTADRRKNWINLFSNENDLYKLLLDINFNLYNRPCSTPLNLRHNLVKYDNEIDIKNKFPKLTVNGRSLFEVIYVVKTENCHHYIDFNNKILCDNILICCNKKIINIMFENDKQHPYSRYYSLNYNEAFVKELYDNKNV
jgi:hypothetical protein